MAEGQPAEFQITEQNVNDNVLTLKVEVDPEIVSGAFRRVHRLIAGQIRVPGFRSGKAPMPVLMNYVGRENFLKEVRRELLPQYYYEAVESLSQRPISDVEYEDELLTQGQPFTFSARVAVAPRIEIGDYAALEIEKPAAGEVADAEVEEQIERLARRKAKAEPAPDSAIENGHLALVNIQVRIDGAVYETLGRRNVTMEVGRDQYLKGFDEKLLGHKKGEDLEFTMQLEGAGTPEHLTGKEATFKVNLKAVRTMILPAIDDEFAKDLDARDLETLRGQIRQRLQAARVEEAREQAEENLKKALVARVQAEPPAVTVAKRVDEQFSRTVEQVLRRGMEFDRWLEEEGKDVGQLREGMRAHVVEEMKLEFALDAVAEKEAVKVEDEDVDHHIMMMARALGKKAEEVLEALDSSGSRILTKRDIAREQAFAKLKERLLGIPAEDEGHAHAHHHEHDHEHDHEHEHSHG